ncbi:MAG TPA: TraR/DksA family transcriptional regulator [Methylomirabilota bacterium]|nr:TraR/DksA family transcriptional regulator [Methylomirabilota bacterium]
MTAQTPIQGPVLRAEFTRRLTDARDALFRTLALTVEEIASLEPPAPGELWESGVQQAQTTVLSRLEEREWRELAEILAAQARFEAGRFGLCLRCGEVIPLVRLRAIPATRYCVTCQTTAEKR